MSYLEGIGTAVPEHVVSQLQMEQFMVRVVEAWAPPAEAEASVGLIRKVFPRSGIERRHSVVPDYCFDDPRQFELFPPDWSIDPLPGTRARMEIYEQASVELAAEAAVSALAQAGVEAEQVTHLVFCTCTGLFAPGPDAILIERLGMKSTVQRTVIGFMGCYAGLAGLRVADQIARSSPDSVVLQVCVETASIHFKQPDDLDTLISAALFGDGASAAVYSHDRTDRSMARIAGTHCALAPDSSDQMAWRIGDHGFLMRLSPEVPPTLGEHAAPFVGELTRRAGLDETTQQFAVHPGGRAIVDAVADALAVERSELESSYSVLRDYGNMSSATILFVLDRELGGEPAPAPLTALAFGPGLTIEGAVLEPPS